MDGFTAIALQQRITDVAIAVAILLSVAGLMVLATRQPAKRLWIIEWSLAGGLILACGLIFSWHVFSLSIVRSSIRTAAASAPILNSIEPAGRPATRNALAIGKSPTANEIAAKQIAPSGIAHEPKQVDPPRAMSVSQAAVRVPGERWPGVLFVLYGSGAACMLAWLLMGHWWVRRLVRRGHDPEADLVRLWNELRSEMERATGSPKCRKIRLLVSDEVAFPLAIGVFQPAVLLPRRFGQIGSEELRPVLAHELAHVMRGDAALRLLAAAFQIAFFYQPIFWWLRRELRLCQEYLADAQAAAWARSPIEYAEQLVAFQKAALPKPRALPAIGIIEGRSELRRRIYMLLNTPPAPDGRGAPRWRFLTASALLILAPALGSVTLQAAQDAPHAAAQPETKSASKSVVDAAPLAKAANSPATNSVSSEFEIAGRVVDEQGRGIGDVKVLVWNNDDEKIRTDKDGFFRHRLEADTDDDEHLLIRFIKPGYAPSLIVDWLADPDEDAPVKAQQPMIDRESLDTTHHPLIVMTKQTFFEGTVRRPDDRPAANVLVRANQGPALNHRCLFYEIWTETRTDANGRYKLQVQPDTYAFEIRAPGIGAARVPKPGERSDATDNVLPQPRLPKIRIRPNEAKHLDIRLDAGVDFRAKIVDQLTSKPLPNIRVWEWEHPGFEFRSNRDGIVTIPTMPTGEFEFQIDAPHCKRGWSDAIPERYKKLLAESPRTKRSPLMWDVIEGMPFDLRPGMPEVTIALESTVELSGRVIDPDGAPLCGATVTAAQADSRGSLIHDLRYIATTKSDGLFTLELPPTDGIQYDLMAHDGEFEQWRKWANGVGRPMDTEAGQKLSHITLQLTRGGSIRGRVVDKKGKPLDHFYVQATTADRLEHSYFNPATRSDKAGRFELNFVRPGRQIVHSRAWLPFDKSEAAEATLDIVTVRAGETIDAGTIVVPPDYMYGD